MDNPTQDCAPNGIDISSYSHTGKVRRMRRLFASKAGRIIIVPIDDSLIFGPAAGLEHIECKLHDILLDPPDALLAFPGVFRNHSHLLSEIPAIVNLTASTGRSNHTRKVLVGSVEQALQLGAEAVAVHVNISSAYEFEMIEILGQVSRDCEHFGLPLVGIMYPRSENSEGDNNYEELKHSDRKAYAELVAHSARVAVDLGVDLIKTKYTGDVESFEIVVRACKPVPIVVAGGPKIPAQSALRMAQQVIEAGGAGVSYGRNVFSRTPSQPMISALKGVVHKGLTAEQAAAELPDEENE